MFDEDDPILARVRALALELPDADVRISHGHPVFFTTKVFAYYGGSVKVDGEYVSHRHSLVIMTDLLGREALLADARSYLPAYLAHRGWVGLDLDDTTEDDEIADLLEASYRLTAGSRRVARLDAMSS